MRKKDIDICERLPQQSRQREAERLVAGKRAVRNAAVDHGDASPAVLGKPEKIRPKFSFGDDHKFRTQSVEVRLDSEGEVQGKVEHVLRAKPLPGEFLPRARGPRNQHATAP